MEKVAIITGATGTGIGRSTALSLARDGFKIVLNYRSNETGANQLCQSIAESGVSAIAVKANIFNQKECDLLVDVTMQQFGRIDALIIGPGADWNPEPPDQIKPEKSLQDVIQEVSPIYSFLPKVLPEMEKRKSGRIIAISSNHKIPSPSYSYNVAKEARSAAILDLAFSCWEHHITVNVVAPGPVEPIPELEKAREICDDFHKNSDKLTAQDIAEIISFLCSDKARFITGNVIGTYF